MACRLWTLGRNAFVDERSNWSWITALGSNAAPQLQIASGWRCGQPIGSKAEQNCQTLVSGLTMRAKNHEHSTRTNRGGAPG